jgi:hypothetical protein
MHQAPPRFQNGPKREALRNPSQGPTANDWEAVKDHVYRLYVIENRTLRNVRTVLSQQLGFRATYAKATLMFRP